MESRVFSTPESAKISDEWVSVLVRGGDELDEAGAAFMERYGVQGYPTLLAVTAGGEVVDRDLLGGQFRDADYIFGEMMKAQKTNEAYVEERARILAEGDAEKLRELARKMVDRRNPGAARKLLEKAIAKAPSPDTYQELAGVLGLLGDRDAERKTLETMIFEYPKHENRMGWRMRRATLHIDPPTDPASAQTALGSMAQALETLLAEVSKENDAEDEAKLRLELAGLRRELGELDAAQAHVDWVVENAAGTPLAHDARLFQAHTALGRGENETARELAEAVLTEVKEGPRAARAHELLGELAYGEGDMDAIVEHMRAVVELVPGTRMAKDAQELLDFIERRRKRGR
jgi:tetratricopeptide (TPR) repeat protein